MAGVKGMLTAMEGWVIQARRRMVQGQQSKVNVTTLDAISKQLVLFKVFHCLNNCRKDKQDVVCILNQFSSNMFLN
jgi:hypothetical protein